MLLCQLFPHVASSSMYESIIIRNSAHFLREKQKNPRKTDNHIYDRIDKKMQIVKFKQLMKRAATLRCKKFGKIIWVRLTIGCLRQLEVVCTQWSDFKNFYFKNIKRLFNHQQSLQSTNLSVCLMNCDNRSNVIAITR